MSQVDPAARPAADPATAAQVWNATYQAQNAAFAQQAAQAQAQQQAQAAAQVQAAQQQQLAMLQPQPAVAAQPALGAPAMIPASSIGGEAAATGGGAGGTDVIAALQQAVTAVEQVLAQLGGGAGSSSDTSGGGGSSGAADAMAGCDPATCTMPCHQPGGANAAERVSGGGGDRRDRADAGPTSDAGAGSTQAARSDSASALRQSDQQLAKKIDEDVLKGTGLAGKGSVIVAACRKYDVPVDFVLAIYRKEASFAKGGTLADRNNNPGNLRFADWQTEHGGVKNGGFTKYPSMDDGINASVHLLSRGAYKQAIDKRDWGGVISIYAPSFENDTATYIKQMDDWSSEYRSKLGIDEHWLHS